MQSMVPPQGRSKLILAILRAGRALISEPERWTQGVMYRNGVGLEVHPIDTTQARYEDDSGSIVREPACFCSLGALRHAAAVLGHIEARSEARLVLSEQTGGSVFMFNDHRTHAEVLAAWDRAIGVEARLVLAQHTGLPYHLCDDGLTDSEILMAVDRFTEVAKCSKLWTMLPRRLFLKFCARRGR